MDNKRVADIGSQPGAVKAARKYRGMEPRWGLIAMCMAAAGPESIANLFPEPKPPKELTDADRERIEAAAERRKRRAAKWAGRG